MTGEAEAFIARWQGSGGQERANAQPFLIDLCALIGVAPPLPATPDYGFEHPVHRVEGDGSTWKAVTAMAGMESGKFPPNTKLVTRGCITYGGHCFPDHNGAGFGTEGQLDVLQVRLSAQRVRAELCESERVLCAVV